MAVGLTMSDFQAFPDVQLFHNVIRTVDVYPHVIGDNPIIFYRPKIKLHGSNVGIRIDNGVITPQSRTAVLSERDDLAGFAKWLKANQGLFVLPPNDHPAWLPGPVTIFGEWCGPGVIKGKGTAISKIEHKILAIFAIIYGADEHAKMIIEPTDIAGVLPVLSEALTDDVFILPWHGTSCITFNLLDVAARQTVAEALSKIVEDLEPCDPWVKETFGVEGTAEGLVYYPDESPKRLSVKKFEDLAFKAKGEKHSVIKTKERVQVAPEVATSIEQFVNMFVTPQRLEQGLSTIAGINKPTTQMTGGFLKWMLADIQKESVAELQAANLTWPQVNGAVQTAARVWFIEQCK
jgi:hypothetical protein